MAARCDAGQACHRAERIRWARTVDRKRLLPVRQAPQVSAWVFFLRASTTSRITAFSSSGSSTLRRSASTSSPTALAFRLRRGAGLLVWLAFLFLSCNAAMPPSRYALTQLWTAPTSAPSSSAACFRACRPAPARSPWSSSPLG